jgi:diguanylate cyclase (GGDEF)-like protein
MLTLVLATGAGTIFGVWRLVGQFDRVAHERDLQTSEVAALRISLVDHEQIGHQLLSGQPVDRAAFLRQESAIAASFDHAIGVFPAGNGTREILGKAHAAWQKGLTDAGLWGGQALVITGLHLEENPIFGAASDSARALLDDLDAPSLRAMHEGLASGERLERYLITSLVVLFATALGVTWHFRRRMSKDLFQPVASMRNGVLKLRSGELDHRILIARNDELGELAAAFNSMTEALHETHQALTQRATCDSLTGLANRAALTDRLLASFDGSHDRRTSCASLLFIDVDDFKDVNDSLGHEAGDALLLGLVSRLGNCVGPDDLVGRLGGDEFAIVVAEADGGRGGNEVAEAVLAALQHPVTINQHVVPVSVSIGVAHRRPDTLDASELLREADFAMYLAKGSGKGRYHQFDSQLHDTMVGHATVQSRLDRRARTPQTR